jgi:excisionase family DNA binding protein
MPEAWENFGKLKLHKEVFMVGHDDHDLLTVSEVAQQLRVDDTTVRRWIKNGVLEAVTLPHVGQRQSYRVRRRTLDLLLNPAALPQA